MRLLLLGLAGLAAVSPLAIANPDFLTSWSDVVLFAAGGALVPLVAAALGRVLHRERGVFWGGWVGVAALLVGSAALLIGLGAVVLAAAIAVAPAALAVMRQGPVGLKPAVTVLVASLAGALAIGAWGLPPRPSETPARQVVLVGIDGADWAIVDRLRAEGRLPTFDRLVEEGARGELRTLQPSLSPAVWTTIATGVLPVAHGVADFWSSGDDVRVKRLWEIAHDYGLEAGIQSYLVTWPPDERSAFAIPGWLAQDERTHPGELSFLKSLERELTQGDPPLASLLAPIGPAGFRNGLSLTTVRALLAAAFDQVFARDARVRDVTQRRATVALETDVFCRLLRTRQPELAIFYHRHIDAAGHLYFRYYDPAAFRDVDPAAVAALGDAIPRLYVASDRALARIRSCTAPGATLIVVSDHGQAAMRSEGQRMTRLRGDVLLEHLALRGQVRVTNFAERLFLRPIGDEIELAEIARRFEDVVALPNGQRVFLVFVREHGVEVAPAIPYRGGEPEVSIGGATLTLRHFMTDLDRLSGTHTPSALILLAGPSIAPGRSLPHGTVLDIAPTVLGLLGLPLGRDMRGRFIEEALSDRARDEMALEWVETHGPRAAGDEATTDRTLDETTKARLRKLGYLE